MQRIAHCQKEIMFRKYFVLALIAGFFGLNSCTNGNSDSNHQLVEKGKHVFTHSKVQENDGKGHDSRGNSRHFIHLYTERQVC